ncbi:MAG: D-glycero-beta-D-manno-heptose 1-phosphate adenylyltransferase [Desulfovibrio sp.]|nr:D-glycero-beta-D-manno-heptose 1-phosphate adenylyltransferase [Desulfovibrio sp.]
MPADLSHPRILDRDALPATLAPLRAQNKTLVFTNGCFDILHPGHVDLLTRARAEGDALILALNSDASVKRLGKGPGRPVSPLAVRAFTAAHLASVDFVAAFDEDTPLELIRAVKPDVLVKGGDWPRETIVGCDFVEAYGGRVLSLPLLAGFSTTSLIARIRRTG